MSTNTPEITVVMPVYNGGKYIKDAIQSILNQTYKDFILLIINDGSSDDSEEQIKSFSDPRIKYIKNEVNLRLGNTLRLGLEMATTKYIARMDQDDISRPERFAKQKAYLDSHPEIGLVGGGYAPFNENGHRLNIFHPTDGVVIGFKFIFNSYFCHPSIMFRKEIMSKAGNYPDLIPEDYPFFSQIVRHYPCANIKEILLDYRETATGMSQTKAQEIQKTVDGISRENYIFFRGSIDGYDEVKTYITTDSKKLSFTVLRSSVSILRKLTNIYYKFPNNILNFFKYYWILIIWPQFVRLKRLFFK